MCLCPAQCLVQRRWLYPSAKCMLGNSRALSITVCLWSGWSAVWGTSSWHLHWHSTQSHESHFSLPTASDWCHGFSFSFLKGSVDSRNGNVQEARAATDSELNYLLAIIYLLVKWGFTPTNYFGRRSWREQSLVHGAATLPAPLKTRAMKYNIFAAEVLRMTPHDRLRAITLIPRLSEAKRTVRRVRTRLLSSLSFLSVWTFRKVEEMNLDLICGWRMGQKRGQMVYHTEKGILEIIAVSAFVSSSVKGTRNSTHGCRAVGGLNEKGNIKHLARCLALGGCSISVSFYFHYS